MTNRLLKDRLDIVFTVTWVCALLGLFAGYAARRLGWWFETDFWENPLSNLAYPGYGLAAGGIVGIIWGIVAAIRETPNDTEQDE